MTTHTSTEIRIQTFTPSALDGVLAVAECCDLDDPWSFDQFKNRLAGQTTAGVVAMDRVALLGCVIWERWSCRVITQLFVHPRRRREGVGSHLLEAIPKDLPLCLMVREHNLAGCLFLKSSGFEWTSTAHEAFSDPDEHGYLMEWKKS